MHQTKTMSELKQAYSENLRSQRAIAAVIEMYRDAKLRNVANNAPQHIIDELEQRIQSMSVDRKAAEKVAAEIEAAAEAILVRETVSPFQHVTLKPTFKTEIRYRVKVIEFLRDDKVRVEFDGGNHVVYCSDVDLRTAAECDLDRRHGRDALDPIRSILTSR